MATRLTTTVLPTVMIVASVLVATLGVAANLGHEGTKPASAVQHLQATQQISRLEYQFSARENGEFTAPNRSHDLRTMIRAAGLEIVSRTEGDARFRLTLMLSGYGRPGAVEPVEPGRATSTAARAELDRGSIKEWFVNDEKGLEHGFTLSAPPAAQPGSVDLRIALGGSLTAHPGTTGAEIILKDATNTPVLLYKDLAVRDANGAAVPARFDLQPGTIVIEIQDRDAKYPLTVDPLLMTPSWIAESNQANALFGYSVATAGDVNGDGYADVIVGANLYDNGQTDEGRAFLYLGSASGLSTSPAWTAEADQVDDHFGESVATAGDVNGDGYADVVIGAPHYRNGQNDEGRAYVYLGSAAGLATSPAWTAESNQVSALFGATVSTAGDVNHDGYADVIIGAYGYDNGQTDEGAAFVYLGSAAGLATSPAWTGEANQADAQFGISVATAGDVNGDGYADVIVGAISYDNGQTDEGRAFVYYGSAAGLSTSPAWTAESNQASAKFGRPVATAGDVNGDGYADVIIGAALYDNGQTDEGRAYVYYGSAAGLATSPAWTAESDQASAQFGNSVATAGDVNGDGYADVIVGAFSYDNGQTDEGRAYAYFGSAAGLSTSPAWTAESDQAGANFGFSVATAGDVDGDCVDDVIVGAFGYDNGQTDEGRAYVFLGSASDACVRCGVPLDCNDGNPCTTDTCNPATGCVFSNNSNPCDDGNSCTQPDACSGGMCVGGPPLDCNDNNPCTDDLCDPAVGCIHVVNSGPCDDGLFCTVGDHCSGGSCVTTPRDCNDSVPCTLDSCDEAADRCLNDITLCGQPGDVDFCAAPPTQMRAWWPLDETVGPTAREIINGNTGTHTNGPTPVSGQVAGALQFDGQNDYVNVADSPTLNFGASTRNGAGDLSIDAWVKTTVGFAVIVDKRSFGPVVGYIMFVQSGRLFFQLADGASGGSVCGSLSTDPCRTYDSGVVVATGNWTHVAVTVDRDQLMGGHFYVNGAVVGSFDPTTKTGSLTNTAPLSIGRRSDNSAFFPGTIDEVEIFGRELSQDDITRIYSASARGKCKCVNPPSDMVSWYPADDCLPGDHIGSNNGTWSGQPFCSSDAKVGNGDLAPFMSTPPTFVLVSNNASLNFGTSDFSVDLWIKTGTSGPIIGKGMGIGPGWLLSLDASGKLSFIACDTSQCFGAGSSSTSVNSNGWRLVGMTLSRGIGPNPLATITYYVDGHPDGSRVIGSMTSMDSVENMLIGASPGATAPYFNGEMDEIEIFRRALAATEVKAIYDADTYGKCKCLDPLPKNMVAWWPLDEQVAPSQDIIGGHNGSWTGSPAPASGMVAGSLSFTPGGSAYVRVPSDPKLNFGTGDFSVDAWVYWLGGAGDQPIVEKLAGANGWNFVLNSQTWVHAHLGLDGASNLGTAPTNTWIHVVLTVQQGANQGIKYYKDGVLQGSATPAQLYNFGGTSNLNIGRGFNGKIDELEIFNRVLQPAEITALYRAGHDGKCKESRPTGGGDIMVEKSLISGTPTAGSHVTFLVIITNNGTNGASSIIVNDLLPPGLIYVSSTLPPGWTYDPTTGTTVVPSLGGQSKNALTITAYLDSCNIVTNCASFVGADITDTNSANDTACVSLQAATPCGAIHGLKFSDANKNGIRDGLEGVVAGQTINLKNSSSQITTATTAGSGQYDFLSLASGTYKLSEQLQPGQVMISPPSGSYILGLNANGNLTGKDFGNYICPAPVTPLCTSAPKGMVAWWPFDETSGPAAQEIIGNNDGQYQGSPGPLPTTGRVAGALDFDGGSAGVFAPKTFSTHNYINLTVDAWINPSRLGDFQGIVEYGANYKLSLQGSELSFDTSPCCLSVYATTDHASIPINTWTHVAAVADATLNQLRLYVNGAKVMTTLNYTDHSGFYQSLGWDFGNWGQPVFKGKIDEVEIFERVLSDGDIWAIFAAGPNGKCKQSKCALLRHQNYKFAKTKIVSPLKICNGSGVPDTFHWSLAGLLSGPGCSIDGPTTFSPTAGTTTLLNPGDCTTINITVKRPAAMMSAGIKACYQATIVPHSASACFTCQSKVAVSTKWYGVAQTQFTPVEKIPYGSSKNVTFTVENLEGDTDVLNYQFDALSADPSDPPNSLVRLNGLPPGTPVTGTLNVPVGTTATVPVSVSYDQPDALSFYDLVLSTDQAAFGTPNVEPLASVGLVSVGPGSVPDPCSTGLPSSDIVLRWSSHTLLTWTGGTCGSVFNVYRGTTTRLNGSDYGSCFDNELTEPESLDPSFPPAGSFDFYLVTGANGQGEGSLGTNSHGVQRPNLNACP